MKKLLRWTLRAAAGFGIIVFLLAALSTQPTLEPARSPDRATTTETPQRGESPVTLDQIAREAGQPIATTKQIAEYQKARFTDSGPLGFLARDHDAAFLYTVATTQRDSQTIAQLIGAGRILTLIPLGTECTIRPADVTASPDTLIWITMAGERWITFRGFLTARSQ